MRKLRKGFTLVEVIIVLAISAIVLGLVYSILSGTTRSSVTSEVKSTLQGEAGTIQNELVNIGTQCKIIEEIVDSNGVDRTNLEYSNLGSESKLSIREVKMQFHDGSVYKLYLDNNILKLTNSTSASTKILAKHVKEIYIRPLDLNTTTSTVPTLDTTNGLQFMIKLKMKKGFSDIESDVDVIVKFRNKGI